MKIKVYKGPDEIDSPIRFATAVIEHCMDVTVFNPDNVRLYYKYLCEVNEYIDTFIRHFNYDESLNMPNYKEDNK